MLMPIGTTVNSQFLLDAMTLFSLELAFAGVWYFKRRNREAAEDLDLWICLQI